MSRRFLSAWMVWAISIPFVVSAISSADAQQAPCVKRTDLLDYMARNYGEAPVARGVMASGRVIEVLASAGGKTRTIIVTMPNGVSCGIASGRNWESIESRSPPEGPRT